MGYVREMTPKKVWLLLLLLLFTPPILVHTSAADFDLDIQPTYRKIRAGESTYFDIDLVVLDPAFTNDVYLTAYFEPPASSITFSDNPLNPTGDTDSVMTITTSVTTPPGLYTITIRGRDPVTDQNVYVDVTLEVLPPYSPGFALLITPSQVTVMKGGKATFTVQAAPYYGFSYPIYLRLICPACASYSFTPNPMCPRTAVCCCPAIPCYVYTSQLVIDTSDMDPGNYSVVVEGCYNGACTRAYSTLTVTEAPQPEDVNLIVYPINVRSEPGDTFHLRVTVGIVGGESPEPLTLKIYGPPGWYISHYPTKLSKTSHLDLWITIPESTPAGTYGVTIELYSGDKFLKSRDVLVSVEKVNVQLSLVVTPNEVELSPDDPNAEVALYLNATGGKVSEASLSVLGVPDGISYSLPPKLKVGELGVLNLTLKDAKEGNYTVTVTASGGGSVTTSTLLMKVKSKEETVTQTPTEKPEEKTITVTRTISTVQTVTVTQAPQVSREDILLIGLALLAVLMVAIAILLLRRGSRPEQATTTSTTTSDSE